MLAEVLALLDFPDWQRPHTYISAEHYCVTSRMEELYLCQLSSVMLDGTECIGVDRSQLLVLEYRRVRIGQKYEVLVQEASADVQNRYLT